METTLASLADLAARAWPVLERNLQLAAVTGLALFVPIFVIERFYGVPADRYQSRSFLHDIAYWFYYRGGFHYLLFLALLFGFLATALAPLRLQVLAGLPFPLQVVLYLVVVDFFVYWIHRAQHHFPFLWAFHSTHHSQRELTFATSQRVHPVDHFVQDVCMFVPLMMLGFDERAWLPLYLWGEFNLAAQHSRIPWRYGPLYRIVVSPAFHAFHHSADPKHHDRNFAGLWSFWDYVFGTAVADDRKRPERFGLAEDPPPSLIGTLAAPADVLRKAYVRN